MSKLSPDPDNRFEELMRRVGNAARAGKPEVGLEGRLLAFADGAVTSRNRRRVPWLAMAATAAGFIALLVLPDDSGRARRPQPPRPARVAKAPGSPPIPATSHPQSARPASPLARALATAPDWRSRRAAAAALARRALRPGEEEALRERLADDPNWRVRRAALAALIPRPGPEAVAALAQATRDPHLEIRLAAVLGLRLRLRRGPVVTDALLRGLAHDPDWRVRHAAFGLLLTTPEAGRAAAIALGDRHRVLRTRAQAALGGSG